MSPASVRRTFQDKNDNDDEEDPVERMLKKTGCIELHYRVQECIAETQDWRKCQDKVQCFKTCMADYQRRQKKANE